MLRNSNNLPQENFEVLFESHPLLEQLGSIEGLLELNAASAVLRDAPVDSRESLEKFLEAYRGRVMVPIELPSIFRAHRHASQNEVRELVALDRRLGTLKILREFASASQRVGRSQLQCLRPLKDERVVRRYLQALDKGEAKAWHTLVYGLTLALYSIPVRQGLSNYVRQTLGGFVHAAARPLRLSETDCLEIIESSCSVIQPFLHKLIAGNGETLAALA